MGHVYIFLGCKVSSLRMNSNESNSSQWSKSYV
jgi:hypothetical protein